MTGRLVLTRQASEDLIDIWLSIASHSQTAADRLYDAIAQRCDGLRDQPRMGVARPDIGEGARMLVVETWLIFYRLIEGGAEVVRVLDGRRDLRGIEWQPASQAGPEPSGG